MPQRWKVTPSLSLTPFFLAMLVVLTAACARKSAPASSQEAPLTTPMAAPAPGAAKAMASGKRGAGGDEGDAKGGNEGPKTWRRAGSATHAARVAIGDKEQLPIRGMQMNVHIDGFRARVVLDTYFENDRGSQYEGTFQLRLPDDATPYFLAFGETQWEKPASPEFQKAAYFAKDTQHKMGTTSERLMAARSQSWRAPKEARIVPKEKAAFAFTETARRQADPALLEWAGAGVFNARLFPIAPHKVHRVVLGYDVNLVRAGDDFEYRLELPQGIARIVADVSSSGRPTIEPKVEGAANEGSRTYLRLDDPEGKTFTFRFPRLGNPLIIGEDPKLGNRFAASVVADLPVSKTAAAKAGGQERAVFALDTSLSSNPDRFNVFLKLLAATLTNNRATLKSFNVLFFNVETTWWKSAWIENTKENVDALLADANKLVLEGATDIGGALAASARPAWAGADARATGTWDTFLLSDGAATWGESDRNLIASSVTSARRGPLFAYNTGLAGTDSAALAHIARESGGAVFSVVGDDEVGAASTAHRLRAFRLVSVTAPGAEDVLIAGRPRYLYPGQPLFVAGRGTPKEVVVTIEQDGREASVPLKLAPATTSPLAMRAYGQVATNALEEMGRATETIAKAYAIHHRIVGETCSLVMLEREEDYQRFGIKPEHEADLVAQVLASTTTLRAEAQLRDSLGDPKTYVQRWLEDLRDKPGVDVKLSRELLDAVATMPTTSFVVRPGALELKARTRETVPGDLLERLTKPGSLEYEMLTKDAENRRAKFGPGDALKTMSSLVEQSPGDGILARDVGFSAIELGLPEHAFFLFRRVADSRPWEPQSYKAMADVLAKMGMADLAIVYYEVSLQGKWDGRFGEFHRIAAVDYLHFLRRIEKGEVKTSVPEFATSRIGALSDEVNLKGADLVIVITWNTDNSDVDLHVTEPNGEECFYSHRKTALGGELTQDVTQGYGPEMYVMKKAKSGNYKVRAQYFAQQRNRASARTKVYAEVIEGWGTPQEKVSEKTVTLIEGKDMHDIIDVKR
jgi:hypothetical protein